MSTVGIVVAHPDDECLGSGGTIALLARTHAVHVLILGEGATSRKEYSRLESVPYMMTTVLVTLQNATTKAAEVLGVKTVEFVNGPDNRFDTLPLLQIIKAVEAWLEAKQPSTIYTHYCNDLNVDHRITAQAVLTATRPTPNQSVRDFFAFEVPSSTEWAFGQCGRTFQPNCFVDITETIETKLKALACYESEMRAYPHPRSPEAIRARAQYWGQVAGVHYAEAFQLIRGLI